MVYFNETSRVIAVYRELPALRLSVLQAARLFSMPPSDAELVLQQLVGAGRLYRTSDDCYVSTKHAESFNASLNSRRAV